MEYGKDQIEEYIDGVFTGRINVESLPEDLYNAIADHLNDGLFKGFGGNFGKFKGRDLELLGELSENIYMFSGAKTYQQVREMTDLLRVTENGEERLRTFKEFKDEALKVYDKYNEAWLKTEYVTAVGQGSSAIAWRQIEEVKSIFPFLKYNAIDDARTSEICLSLNGLVLPVDSPEWDSFAPLNHFNCRCVLDQLEEDPHPGKDNTSTLEAAANIQDAEFKNNPGKSGYVFTPDHPYFTVPKEDAKLAGRNFDLPIPPSPEPGKDIKPVEADIQVNKFIPAKSVKEAEEYAIKTLGLKFCNYSKIPLSIVNENNNGIFKISKALPEIKIGGTGGAQTANKAHRLLILDGIKASDWYRETAIKYGAEKTDSAAESMAKKSVSKVRKNSVAHSTGNRADIIKFAGVDIDQTAFKGIFINETGSAMNYEKFLKNASDNTLSKWWVPGSGDFSQIVSHELGHEIDNNLKINTNADFLKIFNREHAGEGSTVRLTDRLSKYGATAPGGDKRKEMIAEAWAEFTTAEKPRELATEIGELILNEYYLKYIQGSGTNFKTWSEGVLSILKSK